MAGQEPRRHRVVAEHSNLRLGAFFKAEAWRPGPLPPGGTRQGLVFLRRRGPGPHRVDVVVRAAGGERRLRLSTAGSAL